MVLLKAILRPARLDAVKEALEKIVGTASRRGTPRCIAAKSRACSRMTA